MRHLVPSTNYEGYNGRVQLNTAAIWSRARLPNQERGINKAGAAGPHADPHQLCLCQYAAMNRMFPAWMQGQEGRWERRGKHVETNKWREDSRQKLDRVTVRTQEMQWGGITNRKEKFYPLWTIIKENAITLWCAASIKQRISLTLLFRHKEKNMHKVPHLSQKYAFKNDECSWNAGFLNIQSEQFMWEQKKNKINKSTDIQSAEACGQTSDGKPNTPEGHRKARPYKSTLDYRHADEEWLTKHKGRRCGRRRKKVRKRGKYKYAALLGYISVCFGGGCWNVFDSKSLPVKEKWKH